MKALLLAITLTSLFSIAPAHALQKQEIYTLSNKTLALPLARLEIPTKNSLIKMRISNKVKFHEIKKDKESNSDIYQSYIEEVHELFGNAENKDIGPLDPKVSLYEQLMKNSKVDLAKKVAKHEMLKIIQKNWGVLKTTIFNEEGVETWKEARLFTLRKLDDYLVFAPQHAHAGSHFLFLFGQSFVQIDKKTLKNVRIVLDINSRLDSNTLPPEASNIITDDANFSPKQQNSQNKTSTDKSSNSNQKNEKIENFDNSDAPEFNDLEIF